MLRCGITPVSEWYRLRACWKCVSVIVRAHRWSVIVAMAEEAPAKRKKFVTMVPQAGTSERAEED